MNNTRPVAIITGSSRGLGAATAQLLAKSGYQVVINYSKSEAQAKEVQAACEALGAETLCCQADVGDDAACRRMVDEAMAKWGRIDALVNNAATTKFCVHKNLDGLNKDDFLTIFSTNVLGPFQMIRAVAPHMKALGKGAIVNVASLAGITAMGSSVAYCASKAALINMTTSLARVMAPEVRVNAICPGFIQGEWLEQGMGKERYERVKTTIESKVPLRMTAKPEMIANTIRYFIEDAVLTTGELLVLDAGSRIGSSSF